uniref:Holliday junction branch migration complex subunit RuvA n=1 Tax=candidate division WOR-3 bacterium TaxID=2052148 RepID=A0A7C4THT6_UNCW3
MIGRIQGRVIGKSPPYFTIDVAGIGFIIQSPLNIFDQLELNKEVIVYTKCLIKEEEILIYGFLEEAALKMFEELTGIPGVGPKSALGLLSNFTPQEIARAIEEENVELLATVPRVGRKLASKIVLEMKGKLSFVKEKEIFNQAINALCALGLTRSEAINRLKGLPSDLPLEEIIKRALRSK